jgi:L-malate glycosyltransferase
MNKRVLVISHEFPPFMGGAGVVARDTIKKLNTNGVQVTLVTNFANRAQSEEYELIEVKSLPKIRFVHYWNKIKMLALEKFDKIILNDIGASMVGAYFFDQKLIEKTILYLHGSEPEEIFLNQSVWFRFIRFKKRYIKLLKNCNKIVSVSEYMKKKFLEYTKLLFLETRLITIYNGIDETVFFYDPVNLHQKLNIDPEAKLFLSVGRIVEGKGYLEKLKIFHKIIQENNYHWIIAGDGNYKSKLKKFVKDFGLDDRVHLVGQINRNKLRNYYSSVNYFWLLSNFEESLGLVYLESQFCRTPAIGNNHSGVREAVLNNKTGYLIDNPDELIEKLRNEKKFDDADFLKIIKKYSFQNNTEKLLEML